MHGRSRLGNGHGGGVSSPRGGRRGKGPDRRLVHWGAAAAFRRRGALLMAPLVYLALMLVFVGRWEWNLEPPVPVRVGVAILRRAPPPGSVYQSPQVFQKLWPFMQADVNHSSALMTAWHQKATQKWKPCLQKRLLQAELPPSNGFLIIEANGGLNQQRLSICDAVAVAGLLNATLVIPIFHFNSVWRDSSKFGDIFDEEYFTEKLKNHVRVVKELPQEILQRFDNNMSNILNMRSKALSSKTYYLQKVLPKLLEWGAVRIAPFSNRLAHSVPSSIQGLRCFTNYEALHFSQPIRALAERMVNRMVNNSSINGGKYISVHLRFEEDMVAFSCCTYNGGQQEKNEMDKARERGWRGKFHKPGRVISPEANRRNGRCPLTPLEVLQQLDLSKIIKLSCQLAQVSMDQHTPCQKAMAHAMQIRVGGVNIEVGMMLRGMGFGNTTSVYVASGKIYNAEKYMAPLRQLFPLLETKDTLASADELAPFKGHSSQLAALDYTVCAHSEVFVTTQGGNFAHFLMGHRRYLNEGHSKTINPDKKKLVLSFDNPNIRWEKFKRNMQEVLHHSDLKGISLRKPDASLYTFPMPDCMCQQAEG